MRAKLEIAAACHAHAKTPSHCVVTEFSDAALVAAAATRAAREFGYTRMWSIHPAQIRPIVEAFAPRAAEVEEAIDDPRRRGAGADWAPIQPPRQALHDRASYRYFWHVLVRASRARDGLPADARERYFGAAAGAP